MGLPFSWTSLNASDHLNVPISAAPFALDLPVLNCSEFISRSSVSCNRQYEAHTRLRDSSVIPLNPLTNYKLPFEIGGSVFANSVTRGLCFKLSISGVWFGIRYRATGLGRQNPTTGIGVRKHYSCSLLAGLTTPLCISLLVLLPIALLGNGHLAIRLFSTFLLHFERRSVFKRGLKSRSSVVVGGVDNVRCF